MLDRLRGGDQRGVWRGFRLTSPATSWASSNDSVDRGTVDALRFLAGEAEHLLMFFMSFEKGPIVMSSVPGVEAN